MAHECWKNSSFSINGLFAHQGFPMLCREQRDINPVHGIVQVPFSKN